jgi:hypothetical protein
MICKVCVCVLSYTGVNAAVALHVMPLLKTNPFAVSHASDFLWCCLCPSINFFSSFSSVYVVFYFVTM